MCRLFGFRSNHVSTVHPELVTEQNSLKAQSTEHKDGWGIAYYGDAEPPQVARGLGPAHSDPEFDRVSSMVSAHAVVAHVRLASVGKVAMRNAHPFVYGKWAFAHNGTVRQFDKHRAAIEACIERRFHPLIRGETDSERCFYLFLTYLFERVPEGASPPAEEVARALARTVRKVAALADVEDAPPSSLNFLVCDGSLLAATRRHRTLYFSERRRRSALPSDPPGNGTSVEQLLVASEELSFETHWHPLPEDSVLAVDGRLRLFRWDFGALMAAEAATAPPAA